MTSSQLALVILMAVAASASGRVAIIDSQRAKRVPVALMAWLGLLFLLSGTSTVWAANDQPLDIVVVIDNSGSMSQNDPAGLRYQAASMLIDLLGDRDRIAFVTFSTTTQPLNDSLLLLSSPQQRTNLKSAVKAADQSDGGTNYAPALAAARELLGNASGNRQAIFFLTDGNPTDTMGVITPELTQLSAAGIPVYLMLLNVAGEDGVGAAFEATGPQRLSMSNALDVGRAFAFALTDLQPTTYLDVLEGTPGTGSSYQFTADAGPAQKVAEATFVFLPMPGATVPIITEATKPDNAQLRNNIEPGAYSVFSYRSADAGAISGGWQFTSNTDAVTAFTFIRSEIDLQLQAPAVPPPGRRRGVMNGLPFVLGVSAEGGDVSAATVSVRFSPGDSCFAISGLTRSGTEAGRDLVATGLSEGAPLFWDRFEEGITKPTVVTVELKQLDRPLRLGRCFVLWPVTAMADALVIRRPSPNDSLVDGALPIVVTLSPGVDWQRATAFIQAPDGRVRAVALGGAGDSWSGTFGDITAGGNYTIRVLAHGVVDDADVAIMGDTTYMVRGGISLGENMIDLGQITQTDQVFEHVIELEAILLGADAKARFTPGAAHNVDNGADASQWIAVDACAAPIIEGATLRCPVTIMPSIDLPPGNYAVEIHISAEGTTLDQNLFTIRFVRPQSQIKLRGGQPVSGGVATPTDAVLEAMLQFDAIPWHVDPRFPATLIATQLRNKDTREILASPSNYVTAELIAADPEQLTYQLILRVDPASELPEGRYELELQLSSPVPNLAVDPDPVVVEFSKMAAYATVDFTQAETYDERNGNVVMVPEVWGLRWLNRLLGYRAYTTAPLQTFYMTEFPKPLPAPVVEQVKMVGEKATLEGTPFLFAWSDDDPVPGRSDLFQVTLMGSVNGSMGVAPGEYVVRLRMEAPLADPVTQTVRLSVLGLRALLWRRLLPFGMLLGMLVLGIRMVNLRVRPRFAGVLNVQVTTPRGVRQLPPIKLSGRESLKLVREGNAYKAVSDANKYWLEVQPIGPDEIRIISPKGKTKRLSAGQPVTLRSRKVTKTVMYIKG